MTIYQIQSAGDALLLFGPQQKHSRAQQMPLRLLKHGDLSTLDDVSSVKERELVMFYFSTAQSTVMVVNYNSHQPNIVTVMI